MSGASPLEAAPVLCRLTIYPIKSLPGIEAPAAALVSSGALAGDRRWAIYDRSGQVVNGKRTARVHALAATFADDLSCVTLEAADSGPPESFDLAHRSRLEAWLSDFFGLSIVILENADAGFPDDTDAPGPTLVSTATLEAVTSWFPGTNVAEIRRRFRANLEIDATDPFWEDRLVGPAGQTIPFRIGPIGWEGVNPCQRCVVPTRQPETGELYAGFQRTFALRRQELLPDWAEASRFDHYYRLAVNTRAAANQAGCWLRVGDRLTLG
jgi:MOSC domain-containing protein